MRVLIACEESQVVTKAFRALGHEAYSCDLLPCSGGRPQWHIEHTVCGWVIKSEWDMVLAFPPCDHLAVSGARWFKEKRADGRQQAAIDFFMLFTKLDCPHVAIENPVGIMSTQYRTPDQYIQPYQFGHMETKKTCLWLKGLPPLVPTNDVEEEMLKLPLKERTRIHYMPPGPDRARVRSTTYTGIAAAMAEQWGALAKSAESGEGE